MDEEGEKEDDRIREILATLKEREKRKAEREGFGRRSREVASER